MEFGTVTGQVSRRTVVLGSLSAGLLTACGNGATANPSSPGPASVAASQGPVSPGLVPTSQVPLGGGAVVSDAQGNPVVVVQPAAGQYLAYSAVCPHAGCPVSEVSQNQIICPCHGSVFSSTDGSVLGGPAPSGLTPIPVKVSAGEVVAG